MKTLVTSLIILLVASSSVYAAGSPKIGYVSVEKILTESPQVEAVNESMLERFGGRKTELQEMEKQINEMQENYKRNELVMTEDKLNELKNQIIAKIQEFKQKEAEDEVRETLEHPSPKVRPLAVQVAGDLEMRSTLEVMKRMYKSQDHNTCLEIIKAMAKMPDPSLIGFLMQSDNRKLWI